MPLISNEGACPVILEIPTALVQQPIPVSQPGQPIPQAAMTYAAPFVHTAQQEHGPIYHSESVEAFYRVEDLEEK